MVTNTLQRQTNPDLLAKVEHCADPVEYALRCIRALAPKLDEALLRVAEEQVRVVFGETPDSRRRLYDQRNAAIKRDYLSGERIKLLARRYRVSERQVIRIVKGD